MILTDRYSNSWYAEEGESKVEGLLLINKDKFKIISYLSNSQRTPGFGKIKNF